MNMNPVIHLRAATNEDCSQIYKWRNRDEIIALSTTLKPVSWPEHVKWFNRSLKSKQCYIYIIIHHYVSIGKVRFDSVCDSISEISIYIISEYTGKGLGVTSIVQATAKIFKLIPELQTVVAFIRNENINSIRAFSKAGYVLDNSSLRRENHTVFSIERLSINANFL